MHYTYSFDKKALKQLDEPVQTYIIDQLVTNIETLVLGKPLEWELGMLQRYRIGSYRIIADIKDNIFTVVVIKLENLGRRISIYNERTDLAGNAQFSWAE